MAMTAGKDAVDEAAVEDIAVAAVVVAAKADAAAVVVVVVVKEAADVDKEVVATKVGEDVDKEVVEAKVAEDAAEIVKVAAAAAVDDGVEVAAEEDDKTKIKTVRAAHNKEKIHMVEQCLGGRTHLSKKIKKYIQFLGARSFELRLMMF